MAWIKDGLLRYVDKKKSQVWKITAGLQLPLDSSLLGTNNKILTEDNFVNSAGRAGHSQVTEADLVKPDAIENSDTCDFPTSVWKKSPGSECGGE